jgi:DNA-binding CsgD family transcriptional regulator
LIPAADAHLPPAGRAEHEAFCGLIDAARGRLSEARRWIESCTPHSRNVEARGVILAAQCVLELDGPARPLPEACAQPLEALIASGHHDAVVVACRAQPELAKSIVRDGRWTDCLRSILTASRDSALARVAGLEIPRAGLRAGPLSAREAEVYELMAQGRTNREISQTLFISESTTKVHVRHIFEKLGVRSRVEAVRAFE